MKIAIAVHHLPPRFIGGAEWRAYRTARALQNQGHSVQVVCVESIDDRRIAGGLHSQQEEFEGVPVHRLFMNTATAPDPFRWEYDNLWIGDYLRRLFHEWRPDIFHLVSGYLITGRGLLIAQEMAIPSVVTLTDFWFLCRRITLLRSDGALSDPVPNPRACAQCFGEERRRYRWTRHIFPALMRRYWDLHSKAIERFAERRRFLSEALTQAQAVICPSQFIRDVHRQIGVREDRLLFMRQGLDLARYDQTSLEKSFAPILRLGYIGQIAPHKGVHLLIEALQCLPELAVSAHIYGDLQQFPAYTKRLRRLGAKDKRVILAGRYDRKRDLGRIMRDLDALVVTSTWYENSPNAILEGFAFRTPVITARLGGMAELVQHEHNGLHFTPGDATDLARQIQRIATEPNLLQTFSRNIGIVKQLDEEIAELERLYHRLV